MLRYLNSFSFRRVIRVGALVALWFVLADILLATAPETLVPRVVRRNPLYSSVYTEWCLTHMPKKVSHHRIFFLGDSTGQGIKMKVEGLLPTYLEAALRKYPGLEDMEVINPSQVAAAPADKLAMLAAFLEYDADIYVIPLHHRMLAREHFQESPTLYPLIVDLASGKYPDEPDLARLRHLASFEKINGRANFTAKKVWRFHAVSPLIRGWVNSDDFADLIRRLGGKEEKRKSSWVEKAEKGSFTRHRMHTAVAYLDDFVPRLEEPQVPYLRALVRFIRSRKAPVFLYISPTNMGFIEYSAKMRDRDPEPDLQLVRKGIAVVKSVLAEEGATDIPVLTNYVPSEGYSDGDHMLPSGNRHLAHGLAKHIAPLITAKEQDK